MGGGVVDPGPEARVKLAASVMWDENNLTFSVGDPLHAQLMQSTQETLGQKMRCVLMVYATLEMGGVDVVQFQKQILEHIVRQRSHCVTFHSNVWCA